MTRGRLAAALVLVGLTTLAYAPSLTSPFTTYDDPLYVTANLERVTPPGWAGLKLQFDSERAWSGGFVEFFPLRDALYWALVQAFKFDPLPFHLTSLILHLIASLLLWLFFVQLGLPERGAWFGALLFALHPVHIESVVWIAGMKDPMFTMFMLLGLCSWASYRQRPRPWKYALVLLGLICGFLVKSLIVVMPLIMLAMELLLPPRASWTTIAARLVGPFIIAGIFFVQILLIGRANHSLLGPHGGSWMSHTVLVVWTQAKYLKQALLPTSYRLIYCFDPPTGWLDWRLWVGAAVLLAMGVLAYKWRREPLRLFLGSFYVLAMLPVSNLVPFPAIMADRYLYAPTIGSCGLLALLAMRLQLRAFVVISAAVALGLTATTASRSWVWQDEERLWEEPDMDPACVIDTAYPAAQSHILRFLTTKDRREGLMALERAMVSPGLKEVGERLICLTLIGASRDALTLGAHQRATTWAAAATRTCPAYPSAWNAAMAVNLHKRPQLAAGAAMKTWRLEKNPETEVLMWLTLLELDDPRAAAEVLRLARKNDRLVCEKISQFANDAPRLAPALGEANFVCAPLLEAVQRPDAK